MYEALKLLVYETSSTFDIAVVVDEIAANNEVELTGRHERRTEHTYANIKYKINSSMRTLDIQEYEDTYELTSRLERRTEHTYIVVLG